MQASAFTKRESCSSPSHSRSPSATSTDHVPPRLRSRPKRSPAPHARWLAPPPSIPRLVRTGGDTVGLRLLASPRITGPSLVRQRSGNPASVPAAVSTSTGTQCVPLLSMPIGPIHRTHSPWRRGKSRRTWPSSRLFSWNSALSRTASTHVVPNWVCDLNRTSSLLMMSPVSRSNKKNAVFDPTVIVEGLSFSSVAVSPSDVNRNPPPSWLANDTQPACVSVTNASIKIRGCT